MLAGVYDGQTILPDDAAYTLSNLLFCLELYRVADKYDLPELCEVLRGHFGCQLHFVENEFRLIA
jgi:hypothetical protein